MFRFRFNKCFFGGFWFCVGCWEKGELVVWVGVEIIFFFKVRRGFIVVVEIGGIVI